jgi:plasmid stabilization system protein ParE
MKVRYHVLARQDVLSILEYYEREADHQVAVKFFAELEYCVTRIAKSPNSFPEIANGVRRCLLNRFPYQINYEIISPTEVKILVVKDQRRSPDFGLDR